MNTWQRSGMSPRDLVREALEGLTARPWRTALTILGVVVAFTALVATVGLAETAGNRIVGRFDALAATEVQLRARPGTLDHPSTGVPWDAPARLERLNGVVAAGNISQLDVGLGLVSASPVRDPSQRTDFKLSVVAASPGLFDVVHARLALGTLFDELHSSHGWRLALLGASAAERLGISSVANLPAIRIGDDVFLVAGILGAVDRQFDLLNAVIVPEGVGREMYHLESPEKVLVETRIGAASLIGQQAATALKPDRPSAIEVSVSPEPQRVRESVQSDLGLLFVALSSVMLLVGAIGIANVTLVSVMERTGEIGLRRSVGAMRHHVATQFLLESSTMGFAGGVVGGALGTLTVVGIALSQGWTPVLDPWIPLAAPLLGATVGLLAGLYPAWRAASMEPVEALRSAT